MKTSRTWSPPTADRRGSPRRGPVTRVGLLAGVDVGTTSVKVVLMAPDGNEVASGRAPTIWEGGVGGSEADPAGLSATRRCGRSRPRWRPSRMPA